MAPLNDAELEAFVKDLAARVAVEIDLVERQIAKSRAARGVSATSVEAPSQLSPPSSSDRPPTSSASASPTADQNPPADTPATAPVQPSATTPSHSPPSPPHAAPQQQQPSPQAPPISDAKCFSGRGSILSMGRPGRMFAQFKPVYLVMDAAKGILWWDSQEDFQRNPTTPKDSIPWFEITTNSRASKFKKAVTCWPFIQAEDCSKAVDPQLLYFALEYYNVKTQKSELLCLAAKTKQERDEWVTHATTFVKLFLPMREESEAFVGFPVGSATPVHVSQVLDGEAPR